MSPPPSKSGGTMWRAHSFTSLPAQERPQTRFLHNSRQPQNSPLAASARRTGLGVPSRTRARRPTGLLRMGGAAAKPALTRKDTHDSSTAPEIFFFSSSTSAFSSSRLDCAARRATAPQHERRKEVSKVTCCGTPSQTRYRHAALVTHQRCSACSSPSRLLCMQGLAERGAQLSIAAAR